MRYFQSLECQADQGLMSAMSTERFSLNDGPLNGKSYLHNCCVAGVGKGRTEGQRAF